MSIVLFQMTFLIKSLSRLAMTEPPKVGIKAMYSARQAMQMMYMHIFLRISGPINCLYMSNGFNDSVMRPSGSGSFGEWFGSSRALPTGFLVA